MFPIDPPENVRKLCFSDVFRGSKGNIGKKRIINPHHRKVLLEHLERVGARKISKMGRGTVKGKEMVG